MHKTSRFQPLLRWSSAGFIVVTVAGIALMIAAPSFGYNSDPQAGYFNSRATPFPEPSVKPQDSTRLLDAARSLLANRLSISPSDLELVNQEDVRWPDTSLGCPEPGGRYGKVIVPGHRFTFSLDGDLYEVHTATETGVGSQLALVSCEGGVRVLSRTSSRPMTEWYLARRMLE